MKHPDCNCPIAVHNHGDYATYNRHLCRCHECREANRLAHLRQRRAHLYGRTRLTDAAPARAHINRLRAAGMGWRLIAKRAGLSSSIVGPILYGNKQRALPPRKQIDRGIEAKILAVTLEFADGSRIDSTGTVRRLRALVAIGWPAAELARRLGRTRGNLNLSTPRPTVTHALAQRVIALYDELWDKPFNGSNSGRARNIAAKRGWTSPLSWDDDTIDDPTATANTGEPGTRFEVDDLVLLITAGEDLAQAAKRMGVTRDYARELLTRHGVHMPRKRVAA